MSEEDRSPRSEPGELKQQQPGAQPAPPGLDAPAPSPPANLPGPAALAHLADPRLGPALRHDLAASIGRLVGNQRLQRILSTVQPPRPERASQAPPPAPEPVDLNTEPVEVPVHPASLYTTSPAQDEGPSAPARAWDKSGAEAKGATKGPVQSEDEKVNYLTATAPALNDISPSEDTGLTRIRLADVSIQGETYQDGENIKIRVTRAVTNIHWGIRRSGYRIPQPEEGGNITRANWRSVITELQGYEARQSAGEWHHPDATRDHELVHVEWFRGEIIRTWPAIESAIQAHVLGTTSSMNRTQAEGAMNYFLDQKRRDWFNAYGTAPEPPAYRAGQAVLNYVIRRIRNYAESQGWT